MDNFNLNGERLAIATETIYLGLLVQHTGLTASHLSSCLRKT